MTESTLRHPDHLSVRVKLSIASMTLCIGILGAFGVHFALGHGTLADHHRDTACPVTKDLFLRSQTPAAHRVPTGLNPSELGLLAAVVESTPSQKYGQAYTPPPMESAVVFTMERTVAVPLASLSPSSSALLPPFSEGLDITTPQEPTQYPNPTQEPSQAVAVTQSAARGHAPDAPRGSFFGPLRVDGRLFTIDTIDKVPLADPVLSFAPPKEFTPPPAPPQHLAMLQPLRPLPPTRPVPAATSASRLPKPQETVLMQVSAKPVTKPATPPATAASVASVASPSPPAPPVIRKPTSSLVPIGELTYPAAGNADANGLIPIRHLPLRPFSGDAI